MKIQAYQPQVQRNTSNARDGVNFVPEAYGANQSGLKSLGNALGNIAEQQVREQEEKLAVDVAEANNDYNTRVNSLLHDPEKGLLNAQGKNAETVLQQYQAEEKKIREDIVKAKGFNYPKAAQVFNAMADRSMVSTTAGIQNYQGQQRKVHIETVLENTLTTEQNQFLTSPKTRDDLQRSVGNVAAQNRLFGKQLGWDDDQIRQRTRKATNTLVESGVRQALESENFDQAETVLQNAAGYVDEGSLIGLRGKVTKLRDTVTTRSLAEQTYAKFGDDVEGAVKSMVGRLGKPTTPAKYTVKDGATVDGLSGAALSAGERTIAEYNKLHPDDPITLSEGVRAEEAAYGAPNSKHKPSQGAAAIDLISPGLEADPQKRQELLAIAKRNGFSYVRDEYTDPSEGATGGHIHLGEPAAVNGELNQAAAEDKARNAYMEVVSHKRQQVALKVDGVKKELYQMLVQNPDWSTAEQLTYVRQRAGDDPELQAGLFTIIHGLQGNLKAEAKAAEREAKAALKAGDFDVHNIKVLYESGMIKNKQEAQTYMEQMGKTFTPSQILALDEYFNNKDSGKGVQVDDYMSTLRQRLGVTENVWQTWKPAMTVLLKQKLADYQKANNGRLPGYEEVVGMGVELAAEQSTGMVGKYGWFSDDKLQLSDLEVRRWGYTGYEPLPGTGYIRFYKGKEYTDVAASAVWDQKQKEKK